MSNTELKQSLWAKVRGKAFHLYFRLKRPMTLGVRALVLNEKDDTVFLIRHTYVPGWQMPGGGVETGETLREALDKELMEEGNIRLTGTPHLFHIYFNRRMSRRDHVALFVCRSFDQISPKRPDHEIAESGFFPLDKLPEGTTRATRKRLAEVWGSEVVSDVW
ncbi:MAG: NUDIX domain-containing protein [Rhizobiaceae bacterium]